MATIEFDLSGAKGLVERYQGDLNASSSTPNLRYLGGQGQFADGVYNPMKKIGYMSPSVNAFPQLTGTVTDAANTFKYDSVGDTLYISESGEVIQSLNGLDDTTLSTYRTLTSGLTIKDLEIYELYGKKSLFYLVDTGTDVADGGQGINIGFNLFDTDDAIQYFDATNASISASTKLFWLLTEAASENYFSRKTRGMAQAINSADLLPVTEVSGVRLLLSRELGTGSGITIKASIQAEAVASTGDFTSRGAWSNAVTNYAINDTVTNGGYTWQCILAHSAAAESGDEPGVGGSWGTWWNRFGAPDGTDIASGTVALDTIDDLDVDDEGYTTILFSSNAVLSASTKYWVVIEEVGSNMTSGDQLGWESTVNAAGPYQRQAKAYDSSDNLWRDLNTNGDTLTANHDNFDLRLVLTQSENLSNANSYGSFTQERGDENFLYLADNAILYWIAGNQVNYIDGSVVGSFSGRVSQSVLSFPSYMTIADVAETRSRMYLGIQTSKRVTPTSSSSLDKRFFSAYRVGTFVWDRRSQILGQTDFLPAPGAKEIKSLFQGFDGSVYAITESSSGFCEIRTTSGSQMTVLHTLDRFAFPLSRKAVTNISSTMTVWLGANGYFYGFGQVAPGMQAAVYKLGKFATGIEDNTIVGPVFAGHEQSDTSPSLAILFGETTGGTNYIRKWYPNGEGTLNSVAQTALNGSPFTKVEYLPSLSVIRSMTIYCAPVSTADDSTIATVKLYKNQSTTPFSTKTITNTQAARGYVRFELNEPNANAFQMEIEHATNTITGSDEFEPSVGVLEFDLSNELTPDKG